MGAQRDQLAIRTVLVSYLSVLRTTGDADREILRRRALELLDIVNARIGPAVEPDTRRLLRRARHTIEAD